jgi:hypothetical protein
MHIGYNVTADMRTKSILITVLCIAIPVALIGGYVVLYNRVTQGFLNPVVTTIDCPAVPGAEAWFLKQGFRDRGYYFCIKPALEANHPPFMLGILDWAGEYEFSHARWTRDGKAIVVAISLFDSSHSEVLAFAFDFETNIAVPSEGGCRSVDLQPSRDERAAAWKEDEKRVVALADAHGGLAPQRYTRQMIENEARSISFRDVPKWIRAADEKHGQ